MHSFINQKIALQDAGRKGVGYFAQAPIAKGEIVIIQGGRIVPNSVFDDPAYGSVADHCFQIEQEFHIAPIEILPVKLTGVFRVNHSCEPSCGFSGQITLIARRYITPREEITFDYAMTDANTDAMQCAEMHCLCGSPQCRNTITGDDWRIQELQKKYRGYFSTFVQKMVETPQGSDGPRHAKTGSQIE